MLSDRSSELHLKPRILIVDDSRIVRATLIKHIEGLFEFREAFDGEHAWQTLLVDPDIKVVITDLTMPRLDGYELLQRIRTSKISRIRNVPVIVISGSDEQEERDRVKAAGATELITKGVATAHLLSRLDTLSQLVNTQQEFERGLEMLVRNAPVGVDLQLTSATAFTAAAGLMLAHAITHRTNFVLLNICVATAPGAGTEPGADVIQAIGQLLQRTVRQTDSVARTGDAEFTLASNGIDPDSAYGFAQRICAAVAHTKALENPAAALTASCGLVSLTEQEMTDTAPSLDALRGIAHRRAISGLQRGISCVVGQLDEAPLGGVRPGIDN